jgi:hypothetical protein
MKIKNIQQYRSFYKNEIRDLPTRDENFIGNFLIDEKSSKKKFGWFEVYHGDKDGYGKAEAGIENFLQSFLDMAKDGQAVYEFLQNAVDAGSTHYTMIWGKDIVDDNFYLLVANNGRMFDLNSIRSILNVGSSTKTADSKTIGKFGIGFKLAHRLVGKDNGLQELIHENSGPILFSWKNNELENLANNEALVPEEIIYKQSDDGNYEIKDYNPWLFKILITCFPCLPENEYLIELPKMANGLKAISSPFSKNEHEVLSRWVKNNKGILNKETYNEGSLFFIKLGAGKETELSEINLKEGVKFALAILKETADSDSKKDKILHTVQLNDEDAITYPDLEYVKLTVDKEVDKDTYSYIRFGEKSYDDLTHEQKKKIKVEENIEALFGFRKHYEIGDYFKGAPNLYLFFPLSEEVHNFNYILHSNAFYKGSSRTFLHKGSSKEDGINERLLKIIVAKIELELKRLSSSTDNKDKQHFLHFYAALLTSGKSLNQDRLWIEAPFINPIDELLKKYIPIRTSFDNEEFEISNNPNEVYIKKTKIDIDTDVWSLGGVNWFYWRDDQTEIIEKATLKLNIKPYDIFNLLQNENSTIFINSWVENQPEKIKIILSELQFFNKDLINFESIKPQLFGLNILEFSNDLTLSLNQFEANESDGLFLIHNTLNDIKDILLKLNLIVTKNNLDEYKFIETYRNYFKATTKHRGYTELTILFSSTVKDESLLTLSKSEKLRAFDAVRMFNKDSITERIKELKLFNNNLNSPVCFKNLVLQSDFDWLNQFCIQNKDYDSQLKQFLIDKTEELYQYIVIPFWEQILNYIALNPNKSKVVLDEIVRIYIASNWQDKQKNLLGNQFPIIFQSEVIEPTHILYNKELALLTDEDYKRVQTTALSYFSVHIPDKYIIPYLADTLPFSFASANISPKIENTTSTLDDINDLLLLSNHCNLDFFKYNCIIETDGVYSINSTSGKKQVDTLNLTIKKYIHNYYQNDYVLIPEVFSTFQDKKIELSDSKLVEHLIEVFVENDINQELDLIEVVLSERYEDKKSLLDKLTFTVLDATWEEKRSNELYIKILSGVVEGELSDEELALIHNKISITKDENEIIIGKINSANDSIEVIRDDKKITISQSQILNLKDAANIKLIQEFNDEAKKRDLIIQSSADKLFKISKTGITDELVARFKSNLNNYQLENSHQLIFILFSNKFSKEEFKSFSVKFQDNQWNKLEKQLIIHSDVNKKHINSWFLLNETYSDLQSLLQIGDLDVCKYGENEEDIIASQFLFVKGCNPEVLEGSEKLSDKLDYLHKSFVNLSSTIKVYKGDKDWAKYLTFSPNQFILSGVQIASEILPEKFLSWYDNNPQKDDFLKALGVNLNNGKIHRIRKYLTGIINEEPSDIEIERINDTLLSNTINGLAGDFFSLNNEPFIYHEVEHQSQLSLIEKIINNIFNRKVEQYPVLINNSIDTYRVLNSKVLSVFRIDEVLHNKLIVSTDNQLKLLYNEFNIVKQSNVISEIIIESCDELEFKKTFVPSGNHSEHDEPFYHRWKDENHIKLYKEHDLEYDYSIEINDEITFIGKVSESDFYVGTNSDVFKLVYYKRNLNLEILSDALSTDYKDLADAVKDLNRKLEKLLTSIYTKMNSAGINDLNDSHLGAIDLAIKEEILKEERAELIENIKESNDYSYDWFESYLKFLLTFESKQSSIKQKSIKFQEIKHYLINDEISTKYFLLCGASSMIPLNIEVFEDFTIALELRNRPNIKINVEGVSKRGQDLLIYCREQISQTTFDTFKDVIQIKISFSPVIDLLDRLHNAFINRSNFDVWDDIKESLPNLHFIYGPPGTGKTTTLCSMIIDGVKEKYNAKYLLLTPTNKAADVLCKKLLKPIDSPTDIISKKLVELDKLGYNISISRLGNPTDPELDEDIYKTSLDLNNLDCLNVLASSIHRIPYFEIIDEEDTNIKLFKLADYWDFVIFDEASMINLPYLVFAIFAISKFSPNAKFIIAGDPKQIPPVVDVNDKDLEELDIQDENVYKMMGIDSFKSTEQNLRDGDTIKNLDTQFRSVKKVGQLFSDLSYDDLLIHDREINKKEPKLLPEAFKKLISNNVTFIDLPLNQDNSILSVRKLLYSSYHTYSAIFVAEIVKYFDSLLDEKESWSIGLIAPYKAQAILLNKLITSYGISDKLKIYSDTVHGFQGDECDIVFFISNPNNYYYTGYSKCLLSKEYIYNVAISRAKDYLIILHPFDYIPNNPYINKIKNSYIKSFGNPIIHKASFFEKVLFNQEDYIEKNTYITGHDTVNVFGQIEMKYFIKASDSAIDIQLRKL